MSATRSIKIGDISLQGKAFLAPMAGITDAPFRSLAEKYGAAMVVSEMIASANLGTGQREMVRKLSHTGKLPHVVQIAGNQEKWLTLGVKIAQDAGAKIIDINMGCPSKKVTNGYAGSALMRVPERALRLIEAVINAASVPITVKMRLGWNDDHINAAQIARLAENAGVQMIVVHGRTRQQFYKGKARWAPIAEVVDAVKIPVIVNGDIVDIKSANRALAQSDAAGIMVGRGAQGQPWLVGQLNASLTGQNIFHPPEGSDLLALITEHYHSILSTYGTHMGVRVARKHLRWYLQAAGIEISIDQRKSLLTQTNPQRVLAMMKVFLKQSNNQNLRSVA